MKTRNRTGFLCLQFCLVFLMLANALNAQVPDLTNGETRSNDVFWNLGPTGMRGWMHHEGAYSTLSRQIEVVTVDAGSPADGVLAVGDVILGADGTGAAPVAFTSDARIAYAYAIADAEANSPATLQLLVWRAGSTFTMSITLETMGAYSATAPYNCPKSAAILEKGLDALMATSQMDSNKLGLIALLAGYDELNPDNAARMARAQQEAHELILTPEQIVEYTSGTSLQGSKIAWGLGLKLMAISEYYLHTGDAAVYDSMRAYAIAYANGQSMFGSAGHNFAAMGPNGEINGPYAKGYGVVNSANMQCFYGALLAREAGVTDQVVLDAIERASRFYASYAHRGSIPYGEHQPGGGHESNGKCGAAAACFAIEGTRASAANFYTKMAGASADTRDRGHTGPWFNYFWSPIGANIGGEDSMAAYFAEQSWHYDLSRNWDGSFTFDTLGQGKENNGQAYWSSARLQMYMTALITYAMPLKQTYITGKNLDPQHELSAGDLGEVQLATHYDASGRTTNELLQDIDTWSPPQRSEASKELGLRTTEHATILPILHNMATDTNRGTYSRMGACSALGEILDDTSVPILAGLLTDPSNLVRWAAANGLDGFSQEARLAVIDTLLSACITTARPLLPLDLEDPIHLTHARVASAIFSGQPRGALWGHDLVGIDRELLYGAIRATANHPQGAVRGYLANIYPNLSREDVEAVADAVVMSAYEEAPADRMFAGAIRDGGVELLQSHNMAEGVPVGMKVHDETGSWESLTSLANYAGSSLTVVPDPRILDWIDTNIANLDDKEDDGDPQTLTYTERVLAVLDAIEADVSPTVAEPLKEIRWIHPDDATLTLPENSTVLRAEAYDYVQGDSVFTWRKVHGAGEVIFHPNGTGEADTTTIVFDGTPGEYLFEIKMTDSLGLTEVTKTIAMTLYDTGGTLPSNNPPTADAQVATVVQGTPTAILLTGSDPEGLPLVYNQTSDPSHGTITGTAPNLVYTSTADYVGQDSFTFEAMDSEGQVSSATVSITVFNASIPIGVAIYEPFDYPVGELDDRSGSSEVGLADTWTSGPSIVMESPTMTYGILPSMGLRLRSWGVNNIGASRPIEPSALANRGLLDDGSTLWFSLMLGNTSIAYNRSLQLALASSHFPANNYIADDGAELGTGLGFVYDDRDVFAAQFFDASQGTTSDAVLQGTFDRSVSGCITDNNQRLIVGKITWGAASDTLEIYLPHDHLSLPVAASSTLIANVDQSKFDTLTFSRGADVVMDEIRFGPTLQSVLQGTAELSNDLTSPSPDPMTFVVAPKAVTSSSITMTATPAFDQLGGVEYYFTCTAGGGNDSGWQASSVYTDTGLTPGVQYSYTVKARDGYPVMNETAPSAVYAATTPTLGVVPDLVGMQQDVAEIVIGGSGMVVGNVTQSASYSLTAPAGEVVSQTPVALTSSAYGTAVDLVVSLGQDPALPTLTALDITNDQGSIVPVILENPVTYTLTFSEDMDAATIDAADFVNVGSLPITIGTIVELSPGVVTVEVTPNGLDAGTIRLAVAQGASIFDAQGDALNTTSATIDDTTLSVIPPDNWLAEVDAGGNQTITLGTMQPWTPYAMTTVAWYDADDTSSIVDANGAVSQWSDKSGNGIHATQSSSSSRPMSGVKTINGRNTMDFDAVNGHFFNIPTTSIIGAEVWVVMEIEDYATTSGQLVLGEVSSSGQLGVVSSSQTMRLWKGSNPYSSDTKSTDTIPAVTPILLGWLAHTDTKKYSINGVLQDTGNTYNGGTFDVRYIGKNTYANMDAAVGEIIVTPTLTLADRQRLEGYLAHKWGIQDSLADGHPYKLEAPLLQAAQATLAGTATDNDNGPLQTEWSLISGPDGVVYDDASALNATVTFYAPGSYLLELTADDGIAQVTDQVTITVDPATDTTAPMLTGIVDDRSGADIVEDDVVTYTLSFDEDMNEATIAAADFSNACTSTIAIESVTETTPGIFLVVVRPATAGSLQLQVPSGATLYDSAGNALDTTVAILDDNTITVMASPVNRAPVFVSDPLSAGDATANLVYAGTIFGNATDDDDDSLSYAKVSGPAWLAVASDGTLSGTPTDSDVGANAFVVSASDNNAPAVNADLDITVIANPDTTPPNPDPMTWAILPLPLGADTGVSLMLQSTVAPTVDGYDQANLTTGTGTQTVWNDRPAAGQTFTTGVDAAKLNGLTIRMTGGAPTRTFVVRVGTVSGTSFTEIHSESFTQSFTMSAQEPYISWSFATAVALAPNTLYAVDVAMPNSTSSWTTGMPALSTTADSYAGGSFYTSGTGGAGDGTITLTTSKDLAFHLNLMADAPISGDTITMQATGASDLSGVEYYFTETSGNPGGSDSGWQSSSEYTDTGLMAGVEYTYTVTARDLSTNLNMTAPSAAASASTAGTATNLPPVWAADPVNETDATEGVVYGSTLLGDASDPDNDPLLYTKLSGPSWLEIASDGTLSGTPSSADGGVNAFTVAVSDSIYSAVEATLNITVININDAPVFDSDPIALSDASEDSAYSDTLAGHASDPDNGAILTFAKVSGPDWLNVADNGTLSGTPTNADVGVNDFTVSVTDGIIATAVEATLNITVTNTNDVPVFTTDPIVLSYAIENTGYTGSIGSSAIDDDGDVLNYSKVSGPSWLKVANNGALSGTPLYGNVGDNLFLVSVSDGNSAPVAAIMTVHVFLDDHVAPNPDPMTWAMVPAAFSRIAVPGEMAISPAAPVVDVLDVSHNGTQTGNTSVWTSYAVAGQTFTTGPQALYLNSLTLLMNTGDLTKTYVVRVGTVSGTSFSQVHSEGFTQSFNIGTDEYVTWEFSSPVLLEANTVYGIDVGLTSSTSLWQSGIPQLKYTGDLYTGGSRYTSGSNGVGSNTVTLSETEDLIFHLDMAQATGTNADSITMMATTATDESGVEYYFTETSGNLGGSDSGWQDSPFFTDTGLLENTQYTYTVIARDKSLYQNVTAASAAASATTAFAVNQPPSFTSDPINETDATEDAAYSASLTGYASDPEGNPLTYAKVSGPAWLSVSSTGALSGTPTNADVGSNVFTVNVYDAVSEGDDTATLNITVLNTNDAPVFTVDPITGTNSEVDVLYSGTIAGSATDVDAEYILSYSKTLGPEWLTVASDGSLSGTPSSTDVGLNVFTVGVSDGNGGSDSVTLNITVNPPNNSPVVDAGTNQSVMLAPLSGDWTPAAIAAVAWYDAADAASITENAGAVSQWDDKSGNGYHATQATSSKRPVTGLKSIGGLNVLDFEVTASQSFVIPSINMIGREVWAVFEIDDYSTTNSHLLMGGGGNVQVGISSSTQKLRFWQASNCYSADTTSTTTVPVDTPTFAAWLGHTDTKKYSVNGVLENTGNTYVSGAMNVTNIGRGQYSSMDGAIGELIVTPVLSETDRQKMEGYLAHKWGLEANLPAGHPYELAPPIDGGFVVATLNGDVNDPDGDSFTSTWSVSSGPSSVTFGDETAIDTTATFSVAGTYVLELSAVDINSGVGSDTVTITVNESDTTPPTLASTDILDDQSGGPVTVGDLVTYTVTFSEDIDAGTVEASDFGNAGSSVITIGAITETSPGVFTIEVTPTALGSLQLQVKALALISDPAGNAFDTAIAIADDTIIDVLSAYGGWALAHSGFTETTPVHDFDGSGLSNGMEWALGGDPMNAADDRSIMPMIDNSDPNFLLFTYQRDDVAEADSGTVIGVVYGTDLVTWQDAVHDGTNIITTVTDDGVGVGLDRVEVKISRSLGGGNKMFARLKVVINNP